MPDKKQNIFSLSANVQKIVYFKRMGFNCLEKSHCTALAKRHSYLSRLLLRENSSSNSISALQKTALIAIAIVSAALQFRFWNFLHLFGELVRM